MSNHRLDLTKNKLYYKDIEIPVNVQRPTGLECFCDWDLPELIGFRLSHYFFKGLREEVFLAGVYNKRTGDIYLKDLAKLEWYLNMEGRELLKYFRVQV